MHVKQRLLLPGGELRRIFIQDLFGLNFLNLNILYLQKVLLSHYPLNRMFLCGFVSQLELAFFLHES